MNSDRTASVRSYVGAVLVSVSNSILRFRDGSAAHLQRQTCFRESQPLFVRCHVPQMQTRWHPEQERPLTVHRGPSQRRVEVLSAHPVQATTTAKQSSASWPRGRENR